MSETPAEDGDHTVDVGTTGEQAAEATADNTTDTVDTDHDQDAEPTSAAPAGEAPNDPENTGDGTVEPPD